ncbi:hypothetical protein FACS189434_05530 [Bacteroidia bacterium]|nr:hypothetical protein FACS189434_05530 [Bacteroidia bacterium]
MKKINFILMLMLWQAPSLFAANLPSTGYEGPYSDYEESDYSIVPEELYESSSIGGYNMSVNSIPATIVCEDNLTLAELEGNKICSYCLEQANSCDDYYNCLIGLPDGATGGQGGDVCGHIKAYPNGNCGLPGHSNLVVGGGGLTCPIGAETSLLFFAFSYLAMRLWRRKKLFTE